jgi:glycosyltransferase involved in cell wall biosynthesis
MSVELSVVIPIYNEAAILVGAIHDLSRGLDELSVSYDVWLVENGSTDGTALVAEELSRALPHVHTFSIHEPNYGRALKLGIEQSEGTWVICEEIDLCDLDFARRALSQLQHGDVDMVVGSKLMPGARDDRPVFRHASSLLYSWLLRLVLGFTGTDTHGLKAFRRATVEPLVAQCVVDRDVFASELVIRAFRAGLTVREIPVELREKRPPSVHLLRRVPRVLGNVAKLTRAIGWRSS